MNTLDALKSARLFKTLDEPVLEQLVRAARQISIANDQLLFSWGDDADRVYLIVEGHIAIEISDEKGRQVRIATKGPGDVFGEIAALDGGPRSASARAISPAVILSIPIQYFTRLASENPDFMLAIVRDLASSIRRTDELLTGYVVDKLSQRVARALLEMAIAAGGEGVLIEITQKELADRLLSTRERVNQELRLLEQDGVIHLGRGKIVVNDLGAMRLHAALTVATNARPAGKGST